MRNSYVKAWRANNGFQVTELGHVLFCACTVLSESARQVPACRIFRHALLHHGAWLLQPIRRGFEELGESVLVDGFVTRLFRRDPFLREEILNLIIQSLHADVLSDLYQGGAQPFHFSYEVIDTGCSRMFTGKQELCRCHVLGNEISSSVRTACL